MKKIKAGDWVTSYSKGIYRVERVITRYYDEFDVADEEDKKVGDAYSDKLIISKRLLTSGYKKSLGYDSCSDLFIKPLNKATLRAVNDILSVNPTWLESLDKYEIPPIRSIYNMELALKTRNDVALIKEFMPFIRHGRTSKEVKKEMRKRQLDQYIPETFGNYILQLINVDNEQRAKRTVWRETDLFKA